MRYLRSSVKAALGAVACLVASAATGWADVGISTEDPTATLHVVGEDQAEGTDLRIENLDPPQSDDDLRVIVSDQNGYFHAATIDDLAVAIENSGGGGADDDWRVSQDGTPLTIDSAIYTNTRVGIGIKVPAYELDIDGDLRATGSLFASNHVITHATFATSDERFKRDITDYNHGLAQIRAMEPKQFRYTEDAPVAQTDQTYYGLIAQDAARIDPNFVQSFDLPSAASPDTHTEFLGVDSQRLIFTLISAVKEIDRKNQEIDALKARLDALEARMNATETPTTPPAKDTQASETEDLDVVATAAETQLFPETERQTLLVENTSAIHVDPLPADAIFTRANHISNPGGYF